MEMKSTEQIQQKVTSVIFNYYTSPRNWPSKKADLCSLKAVMTTLLWSHITQSTDNYICTLCDLTQSGTEIKIKQQTK